MSPILESLSREHANLAKLLKVLARQIEVFKNGGAPDYHTIRTILEYNLEYADLYHHPKEDLIFARLRKRYPDTINTVNNLEEDHRRLAAQTRRFAEAIGNIIEGAELPRDRIMRMAEDYLESLHRHMEMEDKWVFPAAQQWLTDEDWADIEHEATTGDDPLFGPQVGDVYGALREELRQIGY
jgi:hemerythrin-like domain-containing protein